MSKLGKRTFVYETPVYIRARACMAGPKEGQGPLADSFDIIMDDDLLGQKSWEYAECEMLRRTVELCAKKAGIPLGAVGALLAGDLNAQIISSGFAARELGIPFLGLYGACSTMAESLLTGAALVSAGYLSTAIAAASSHFCTAERQFRFPLELGTQRPPSSQWTATAAGAVMLDSHTPTGVRVTHGTLGRVIDLKVKDANHMGAAMAPAVADTICAHFEDVNRAFIDYDIIATGDLGAIGLELLKELLSRRGVSVDETRIIDCGKSLFSPEQDTHAGGSGCGCIAGVLAGHLLNRMESGEIRKALIIGSGAMLSLISSQQGESIPSIAYAVALEGSV